MMGMDKPMHKTSYFRLLDRTCEDEGIDLMAELQSEKSAEQISRELFVTLGESVSAKTLWRYRQEIKKAAGQSGK